MSTARCPSCQAVVGLDVPACAQCGLRFAPGRTMASSPPPAAALTTSPPVRDVGLAPGTVVAGRFLVEELLGSGGMGTVYRARHLGLDKTVCLKTLRPSLLSDPSIVGRFEREAKAASRLDHPNSVQVLDFGQDDHGQLFIVMEYVPGIDLRRLFTATPPPGPERLGRIAMQVLAALGRAHAMGIIHRDLKPENIVVGDRPGEPDFVKVLDFGIAKIQDAPGRDITRPDLVCGTPEYMSPEQAMGREADARSDLYAVGVLLYQGLTGALPFEGRSPLEVLQKQVHEPLPTLVPLAGPPPPALVALVARALEKDPALRPQSAEAFRAEIAATIGLGLPSPSGTTTPPPVTASVPPAPRRRRRRRWPWVALALVAAALAAGLWAGAVELEALLF